MGESAVLSIQVIDTTSVGRSVMTAADAAAARTAIGAGTSSFDGAYSSLSGIPATFTPSAHNQAWSTITSTPTTLSGYGISDAQPLDSDLTAIAALTTTSFGRSVLTQADAAAVRALIGAGTSSFDGAYSSLSGIPSTFAPSSHTHTTADITGFAEAVDDEVATLLQAGSGISLNYNDVANTLTISASGGGGSPGGADTQIQFNDAGVFGGSSALTFNKTTTALTLTQAVRTTGSPTLLAVTGAAHTTLTASTEATDINFNLARTVQFAAGALATQRAFRIQAPTYAFASASTITTASTLSISGAPTAGTNATITNAWALNVESGNANFAGAVTVTGQLSLGSSVTSGSSRLSFLTSSAFYCAMDTGFKTVDSGYFGFSSTNSLATTPDVIIVRDAAGTLALRNSTNAQTFNIYGTYTSTTSFERLCIKHTSTQVEIGQQKGSAGGSDRPIVLGHYGSGSTITAAITIATDDVVKIGPLSHVLSEVTITDAAVTMVANRRYVGSIAAFTADRNYTLPAGTAGDVIEVQITTGDDLYELILLGASGVSINGGSAATEWSRLFISNEFVRFRCHATNDWRVEVDGRVSSRWYGYLAANVANHYANDSDVKIPLDTVGWNVGDIGSIATDQVTVRRSGYYDISGSGYVSTLTQNATQIVGLFSVGGVLYRQSWVTRATSGIGGAGVMGSLDGIFLSAGTVVFFILYQNDGGSRMAEAADRYTYLSVSEAL